MLILLMYVTVPVSLLLSYRRWVHSCVFTPGIRGRVLRLVFLRGTLIAIAGLLLWSSCVMFRPSYVYYV